MKKSKKETNVKVISKKKLSIDVDDKNKGGRPPIVLSDEQIKELEELAAYLTTEQIADYFGISRVTFAEIRERQTEVSLHYKKGRARKILKYVKQLDKKIFKTNASGDTTALIFALKTQGGWSEKQELNVTTKDITPKQPPSIINHFSDEPLAMELKNDE